jgi:hypothetical protein
MLDLFRRSPASRSGDDWLNSDEASVMAVFGIDLAGQIQKLRRERRLARG